MTSKILWCDETWNPIIGCSQCSPGCEHCYAVRMAHRLRMMEVAGYTSAIELGGWTGQTAFVPEQLDKPLHWKRARRIFLCSMGDWCHPTVKTWWIDMVLAVMAACPQHTFLTLTKRPELLEEKLYGVTAAYDYRELGGGDYLPNVWIGATVENQETYTARIEHLVRIPAAGRFLSIEPMLGPIDLQLQSDGKNCVVCGDCSHQLCDGGYPADDLLGDRHYYNEFSHKHCLFINGRRAFDWVIVGGETGPGARPMHPGWVRGVRDQCAAAGVPFFFKGWGEWQETDRHHGYEDGYVTGYFDAGGFWRGDMLGHIAGRACTQMVRVGKKAAGRVLDGREWDEFPV